MSHLFNFRPAGKWGKEVFDIKEDHCTNEYSLMSVDDSQVMDSDKILGISPTGGMMKVIIARLATEVQASSPFFDDKLTVSFYSISHPTLSPLKLGRCYAFKWMDPEAECMDDDDLASLEDQTLGIYNHSDDKVYVLYVDRHSNLHDDEEGPTKKSAAFEPLYFGDKEHEVKDPRAATDLWIATLSLDRLKKTGQGKTGYERQLKDDSWKNCHSYKEVLDAASEEAGVDMYDEFLNHPEKFPTISAMGDKAFIKRRASGKTDVKPRKSLKVG